MPNNPDAFSDAQVSEAAKAMRKFVDSLKDRDFVLEPSPCLVSYQTYLKVTAGKMPCPCCGKMVGEHL